MADKVQAMVYVPLRECPIGIITLPTERTAAAASLQLSIPTDYRVHMFYGLPSIRYCIIETASACPRQFTSISLCNIQFD